MTSEQGKARHWWLHLQRSPYHSQIFTEADLYSGNNKEFRKECTHVIEYSAYLAEKERADRIEKDLRDLRQALSDTMTNIRSYYEHKLINTSS